MIEERINDEIVEKFWRVFSCFFAKLFVNWPERDVVSFFSF